MNKNGAVLVTFVCLCYSSMFSQSFVSNIPSCYQCVPQKVNILESIFQNGLSLKGRKVMAKIISMDSIGFLIKVKSLTDDIIIIIMQKHP